MNAGWTAPWALTFEATTRTVVARAMADPDVERLDVLYDGECAFCTRALSLVARADRRRAFHFIDATRPDWRARFPRIRPEDTAHAMLVVIESGEVFSGFYAFRRMLWPSPWLRPLIPLFYAPGATVIGPRIYGWIARNRRRLGCRTDACERPAGPR